MDFAKNQVLSRVISATVDRKEKLVSFQTDKKEKRFSNLASIMFAVSEIRF